MLRTIFPCRSRLSKPLGLPLHFFHFFPEPHGHGSLRPTFLVPCPVVLSDNTMTGVSRSLYSATFAVSSPTLTIEYDKWLIDT